MFQNVSYRFLIMELLGSKLGRNDTLLKFVDGTAFADDS